MSLEHAPLTLKKIGAESSKTADALSELYPTLSFVVQVHEDESLAAFSSEVSPAYGPPNIMNPRVTVTRRRVGTAQPVRDAAAYILRVPSVWQKVPSFLACASASPNPTGVRTSAILRSRHLITSELRAHLDVLRANTPAMVILTIARPNSDKNCEGTKSKPQDKGLAHVCDLVLLELTGEGEVNTDALSDMVEGVADEAGKLCVVHRLASQDMTNIAWVIKYQSHAA